VATLQIVEGDTLPRIVIPIKDRLTGEIVNITGCTAQFCWRVNGGTVRKRSMVPLTPLSAGKFAYQLIGDEFSKGTVEAQLELKTADLKIATSNMIIIEIEEKLVI